MHGLHDVDQKDTIIGVPSARRVFVLTASPLEFSTVTDGTCAAATAEIRSARLKSKFLILLVLKFVIRN
jgi:hypothetical protein